MSRRQARWMATATVAILVIALGLVVAPLRIPTPPREAQPDAFRVEGLQALRAVPAEGAYAEVVQGNVFSPTREPPVRRGTDAPAVEVAPAPGSRFRLSGLVRGADGVLALIDADPSVPGAEIYRVGDAVGPYRLTEATDTRVVLRGELGTQVLTLDTVRWRIP